MTSKINYVQKSFDNLFSSPDLTLSDKEKQRLNEITSLIPDSVKTILDAGSGDCRLSNLIQLKGCYKVVSTDIGLRGLRNAKSKTVNSMINSLPFRDNYFDLVICSEVLEHLPENIYYESLSELLRVSKKYILITVPNNENLLHNQLKCNNCDETIHTWGHLRKFNKESFGFLSKKVSNIEVFGIGPPKKERSLTWLFFIGRKFGNYYDLTDKSICTNCGNTISNSKNKNLIGYISFRLIWRINKYFPKTKGEKIWLAFLLKK